MFDTEHLRASIDYGTALIESDYEDLLYADSPILLAGVNANGQPVVGSSITFDRETKVEWYFHAVVTEEAAAAFRARRINYPTLLRGSALYLVGWEGTERPRLFTLTWEDIPQKYRPSEEAFCPEPEDAAVD